MTMGKTSAWAPEMAPPEISALHHQEFAGRGLTSDLPRVPLQHPTRPSPTHPSPQKAGNRTYLGRTRTELIQSHMTHKPMLRGELDARALRVLPYLGPQYDAPFYHHRD